VRRCAGALMGFLLVAAAAAAQPPAEYVRAVERLRREGRAAASLVRAGDAKALFSRFDRQMVAAVPLATLKKTLDEHRAAAPIGERVEESLLPTSPRNRTYVADHRWGKRVLTLQVSLDPAGKISGMFLNPRAALPPDPKAGYRNRTALRLPFDREWWVFWGGATEAQNYHVVAPDQRYAYDFCIWREGGTHRNDGSRNEHFWAWGQPVLAPAAGTVAAVHDGEKDNRPLVEIQNLRQPAGNHVVLDLGGGEFALLAHFQRGSVRVKQGEQVRTGQVLGLCGNSGNSSEPHLHMHLQERAALFGAAKGLPAVFEGYRADGKEIPRGAPVQGQFIRHLDRP